MANVTITAANVVPGTDARFVQGVAGATIAAGDVVYLDSTTGTYKLADADLAGAQSPVGIAVNGASSGQQLTVQVAGSLTIGGTLVAGTPYVLSATAGKLAPFADLVTPSKPTVIGIATSTSVLKMGILESGVAL